MPEHRRRRATPSGARSLAPFGLRAAQTRLLCCGSSMMLGHHPPRRASYPDPRRVGRNARTPSAPSLFQEHPSGNFHHLKVVNGMRGHAFRSECGSAPMASM